MFIVITGEAIDTRTVETSTKARTMIIAAINTRLRIARFSSHLIDFATNNYIIFVLCDVCWLLSYSLKKKQYANTTNAPREEYYSNDIAI